jgi:hypothetical protein
VAEPPFRPRPRRSWLTPDELLNFKRSICAVLLVRVASATTRLSTCDQFVGRRASAREPRGHHGGVTLARVGLMSAWWKRSVGWKAENVRLGNGMARRC